jgi:plasmid stabilization system protein ParE
LSYTLHPLAAQDIADAARFYRREGGRAVAARFLDEFDRAARLLGAEPGLGTPTDAARRWFPLHGFPYSLIYRAADSGIRVLVLRHQHRDPDYGESRR